MRILLSCLCAVLFSNAASADTHSPVDLPTPWKAMILDDLQGKFPGADLLSISTTVDLSGIVTACGIVHSFGNTVPFYIMLFPGDPPQIMPVVGGVNDDLASQVRAMCQAAAIPLA